MSATATKAKYKLTPEHRAQLKPWADKWIKNALSTEPMERERMKAAVLGQYKAAGLKEPRIVFASSPFVMRFAAGFATQIWHERENGLRRDKPRPQEAGIGPIHNTIVGATVEAAGTNDGPEVLCLKKKADLDHWYVFGEDARKASKVVCVGQAGLGCAEKIGALWRGNNQWSAWAGFLSFFRHVAKLPLDYSNWHHYEEACLAGGPMIVHKAFCIISDRPQILTVDERNRPHSDTGPFCQWRDGSALFAVHGTRIPAWIIARPDQLSTAHIEKETNAEIRRVMMNRFGLARYLLTSGAKEIHQDDFGTLYRKEVAGDEAVVMVKVVNSTAEPDGSFKDYFLRVPPTMERARAAVAWTFGLKEDEYGPDLET